MGKKKGKFEFKSLGRSARYQKKELKDTKTNLGMLNELNLPKIETPEQLASFFNTDYSTLKEYFLIEGEVSSQDFLYRRFKIKKKSSGFREILAPKKELRLFQDKIHKEILRKISPGDFAHGFRPNFSIVTNAKVHLNARIIYNLDLKDFFPSIWFGQVIDVFKHMGYSGLISSLLASLCTAPPRIYDNGVWKLHKHDENYLPQGAPTSPAISNLACIPLDESLNKIATNYGFRYTRYADDLSFSSTTDWDVSRKFKESIFESITYHGFTLNKAKKRLRKRVNPNRQNFMYRRVTGIIVHKDHLGLPRFWVRRLRAALHELKITNLDKNDPALIKLVKNIEGRCSFANMVNKEKYSHFYEEFRKLKSIKI